MYSATFRAVLFTKENCKPCKDTKDYVNSLFETEEGLAAHYACLQKENHAALVASFDLDKFPTLLITNDSGREVGRFVGGNRVREVLPGVLNTLKLLEQ